MNRRLRWTLPLFAALLLTFFAGPREPVDTQLQPPALPADLDAYLAREEARFPDIVPGAEKTIVWAHADHRRTPLAVVYLHGFSATRQETAPLSDDLARRLGANLFYTRLSGHGRSEAAMAEATAGDWLRDAREALAIGRRLGERVLLVGTSTGGTLATWLAGEPGSEALAACVLISPNFAPHDPASTVLSWPWARQFVPLVLGTEYQWTPRNAEQARYWSHRYPSTALLPMMALVRYVEARPLEQIRLPLLVIYSPGDQVVDPQRTEQAFARFGSPYKQLIARPESQDPAHHVLAGRILAPDDTPAIEAQILQFLDGLKKS